MSCLDLNIKFNILLGIVDCTMGNLLIPVDWSFFW